MSALIERIKLACAGLPCDGNAIICRCAVDRLHDVMDFIESHWRAGHIMAHDRELVNFMHLDDDGQYNFAVSIEDGKVCGILGYIPTSRYDCHLSKEGDRWLAIWKNIGDAGSGLRMMELAVRDASTVAAIGINDKVARLYKFLGFEVFSLKQYYVANPEIEKFEIAKAPVSHSAQSPKGKGLSEIVPMSEMALVNLLIPAQWRPRKTSRYLIERYLHHPIYTYQIWAVRSMSTRKISTLFVTRQVQVQGARCIRIVDVLGDLASVGSLQDEWLRILHETGSEYVDVMTAGLSDDVWQCVGFERLVYDGETVMPNYFEPFVRENVVIKAALWNPTGEPYVMFKGDSDQDRPNAR